MHTMLPKGSDVESEALSIVQDTGVSLQWARWRLKQEMDWGRTLSQAVAVVRADPEINRRRLSDRRRMLIPRIKGGRRCTDKQRATR